MKKLLLCLSMFALGATLHAQLAGQNDLQTVSGVEHYIEIAQFTTKESKKAFNNIKTLAEQGDADAMCLLGVLYKDGVGTPLNFNKARRAFKKSYELGSEKGAYSLGYLHLKGLGNIPQDYSKAIKWFKKSKYPMATHWLAKMNFLGLGMAVNREKAMDMLANNAIGNSEVLLPKFKYYMGDPDAIVPYAGNLPNSKFITEWENALAQNPSSYVAVSATGKWTGEWEFMDWSDEKVARKIPLALEISESGFGDIDVKIVIGDEEFTGKAVQVNNELIFSEMHITLKKAYTDYADELELTYRLSSFLFDGLTIGDKQFIRGSVEATVTNWSEPSPPSSFLLQREGEILDAEMLSSLSEQQEHFIKVYPNPFKQDLVLFYTLDEDATVTVKLYDYYNPSLVVETIMKKQEKGERKLSFKGLDGLAAGLYSVIMDLGSESHARIVIKE